MVKVLPSEMPSVSLSAMSSGELYQFQWSFIAGCVQSGRSVDNCNVQADADTP